MSGGYAWNSHPKSYKSRAGTPGTSLHIWTPWRYGSGRGPDAGRTIEFKGTDAARMRTGRGLCRSSPGGAVKINGDTQTT
eukprot:gene16777-biopygen17283